MPSIATITSKRQLTIPVELFKKLNFSKGDKVIVKEKQGSLTITKAQKAVDELYGSISIPEEKRGADVDQAIAQAKLKRFKQGA